MLVSRFRVRLLTAIALVIFGVSASSALAGVPTTVTVRVQGVGGETLVPQKEVTTTTTTVPVEGGSCSGTSAGGALYDAAGGNWKAFLTSEGVEIVGIDGVNFPRFSEDPGIYWAVWINGQFAQHGACEEELTTNGTHLVFVAQCYEVGPLCATKTAPDHFLTMAPPRSAVNVGEPLSVTIGSLSTELGSPEPSLPPGVTVSAGALSTTPGPGGVATLTFPSAGTYTLQASAPDSVASDAYTVCVHNGNDGTCGSATSGSGSAALPSSLTNTPYTGPFAVVADVTGLLDAHHYSRSQAPRILSGRVTASAAVSGVDLRLTRTVRTRNGRSRCSYYNGVTDRFRAMRCGAAHGKFFSVGAASSFSYLLPFALPRGRYVLDVQATDAAGSHTQLARGTSRVVFYVD